MSFEPALKPNLRTLLSLAWPIIVSRSTQVVVGLADALMTAHLGATVLGAVTAGAMNAFAAIIFPMGVAFIVSSFSSQLAGRGQPAQARAYALYGLAVAVLAQGLALILIPLLPTFFARFHYEPSLATVLQGYLAIRLLSTAPAVGIEALGNYYSGLGDTKILMKANVAAMTLNLAFNWILIDGNLGVPPLGARGAAWASVAATTLAFAGFLAVFLWQGRGLAGIRLSLHDFWRMLKFGVPSGLNWSFEFFAFLAFINLVVAGLGTSSLAAMMAVIQINSVSFMPAFGLGSAGAVLVGQAIGAGRKDEVPGLVALTFKVAALWMALVGLACLAFPQTLLAPFARGGDPTGAFMGAGVLMLSLSAFWQALDAASIVLSEALRAAGDTAFSMWVRGAIAWGLFLPGSWLAVRHYETGDLGLALSLMGYLALLAAVLYLRFRSGAWRRIELVEPSPVS